MKKLKWLVSAAIGILIVVGVLLSIGSDPDATAPHTDDFGPSGLSAYARLLERQGFALEFDQRRRARPAENDLLIVPWDGFQWDSDGDETYYKSIEDFVLAGGSVMVLDFSDAVGAPQPTEIAAGWGQRYRITPFWVGTDTGSFFRVVPKTEIVLAGADTNVSVKALQIGEGRAILVRQAQFLNNDHIAEADNARYAVDLVRSFRPGRVVFAETLMRGPEVKGLFATLGNWASAARWQFFLLLAVVIIATTVLFGPPRRDVTRQRSARDLVDAVADVLRRGHKHYEIAYREREDARLRVVQVLGCDPRTEWAELLPRLPDGLKSAATPLYSELKEGELLPILHRLHHELDAFEADSRRDRTA